MPSPSKAKGNSWELEIAKFLSSLYNESFIRAPGSGAYVGGINAGRKLVLHEAQIRNFKGDIVPGPSFPKLNIEAKNYGEFPFHQLFADTPVKKLEEWLGQLLVAADENDFSLLLLKVTHKGKFVLSHEKYKSQLQLPHNSLRYLSPAHGPWQFSNFDVFWQTNHLTVKNLCS